MNDLQRIPDDCLIPEGTVLEEGLRIGPRVLMAGEGICIRKNARIDAAAVIGEGVTIGQNAWVKDGSVVLKDVPPNGIVQGNPAVMVGYQQSSVASTGGETVTHHFDIQALEHLPRPARVPLQAGDSALYLMRRFTDARGSLSVGEVPSEVPFTPARYFVVFDVPSVELRGEHAHKECQQFLMCLHGSIRVLLDDGNNRCEVTLDRPDMGVFMPAMIWGTQYRYSPDAVLLVFASHTYDDADYLRTYDDFLSELGH